MIARDLLVRQHLAEQQLGAVERAGDGAGRRDAARRSRRSALRPCRPRSSRAATMAKETMRISSSSSMRQIAAPCSSPSASRITAARCGPVSSLTGDAAARSCAAHLAIYRSWIHAAQDGRDGFLRIAVDELADLLERLRLDLAVDLGEIDHARSGFAGGSRRCRCASMRSWARVALAGRAAQSQAIRRPPAPAARADRRMR